MYNKSEFKKEVYKPKDLINLLGITHTTLYNYEKKGKIKITYVESDRRVILREDLLSYLDSKGLLYDDTLVEKRDYIYARVSGNKQAQSGDLDRQVLFLVENVPNLNKPVILKEIGSGLNDKRPKLIKLIDEVIAGNVGKVYITYKDRLTRFGFNYLEHLFNHYGTEIVVVKDNGVSKTMEEELTDDLMSLIASFSGKLYGARGKKISKKLSDVIHEESAKS